MFGYMRFLKRLFIVFLLVLFFADEILAVTVQKMYSISGTNLEMVKSGLLNIYDNKYEVQDGNYSYLYDNQDRFYLAYLVPINDYRYYYYYLSNVNDQKNKEMLNWLEKINYTKDEVTNANFIDKYREEVLNKNQFLGKLKAIQDGTLGVLNAKNNSSQQNPYNYTQYVNNPQINNYPYNNSANYTTANQYNYNQQAQLNYNQYNNYVNNAYQPKVLPSGYMIKVIPTNLVALCSVTRNETYTTLLAEDIFLNGEVVIPKGSHVVGTLRPNIYRDYNKNYLEVSFDKIIKPDGSIINIRTENRPIYNTLRTQNEYMVNNNNSSSQNSSGGISKGGLVALGLLAIGVVAAGVVIAATSGSSSNNSSSSTSSQTKKSVVTPTTNTSSYTTTTAHRLYLTNQTPRELCPNNDIKIEKNALIDIAITNPVYLP